MKKLFLLMGMAAAMINFAGCQKNEIEDPNANLDGSTFELVAEIAQTKTTLDPSTYAVDWVAGDVIYMVTSDGTWGKPYADDEDAATIAEFTYADGKFATTSTIGVGTYTFKAMYAKADQKSYHRGTSTTHKLEAVQDQDCSDPTSHVKLNDALIGTFEATTPIVVPAEVTMSHIYTLMQVDVKNNTGAEIDVTKFEMTAAGADLAGVFNVESFETPSISTKSGASSTITVNVTNGTVANNASLPVYFVMAPLSDYSGDVTFKVTDEEGKTYTKTVTLNGISFEAGKYNTTPYTIMEADELPADVYGLVEVDGAFEDGAKYVLAFKDGKDGTLAFINSKGTSGTVVKNALEVTSGTIVNPSSDYVFTAVKSGDGFNFKNSAGKYIYNSGSNTTLNTNNTTATVWKPTFLTASGTYKLVATRYIAFNGSDKAMGYATSNFKDQVANGLALAQYAGAISVFKLNYIPVVTPKILVAETNVTALADSEYVEIPYSTENVSGIISAVVTSDVDGMVSGVPVVESDKVTVYLNANETDNEKGASITLSYDGAEDVVISISQYAASSIEEGLVSLYENVTSTNSAAPDEFVISVTDAVVTYVNGNTAFIEDETAGMQIYMTSHGLQAGNKLTGTLTGKAYVRYGVCQISDYDFDGSKVSGATIPVSIITISDLLADYNAYVSRRVKIENATVADAVSGTTDKNGKVCQGENIINLYNNNSSVSFVAEDVVDFVAYPSYYNTDKQLATYEAPVSKKVNAPSISCSNNEVTITCTTVDATIYFAIDEDIYSEYTGPFPIDEDCTVKAYATKEGLIDSDIVTANLTWVDPNSGNQGIALGASYSYTFTEKQWSANGSKTLGNLSWSVAGDGGYWGYDGTKGQQFGSGSKPYKSLTVSTSAYTGGVKTIKVSTSGASSINGKLTVTVDGKQYGSTVPLTSSNTEYTFEVSDADVQAGEIVFSYTQTSSKALYIKSIKIN